MDKEVVEEKKDNVLGIIGVIVGGIIGATPWLLLYIFLNLVSGLLSAFIPIGALLGYKIFKGKYTKGLKKIIIITSFIIVSIVSIVIIPYYYSVKLPVNIMKIYKESWVDVLYNWFISVVTTAAGVALALAHINKSINKLQKEESEGNQKNENTINSGYEIKEKDKENLEKFKKIFNEYGALDKKSAIDKEKVYEHFGENDEKMFKKLVRMEIIKKSKGKYYYAEKNEKNMSKEYIFAIVAFIAVMVLSSSNPISQNSNSSILGQKEYRIETYQFSDTNLVVEDINHIKESDDSSNKIEGSYAFETDEMASLTVFCSTKEEVHNILNQIELVEEDDNSKDMEVYSELLLLNARQSYEISTNDQMSKYKLNEIDGYKLSTTANVAGDEVVLNVYLISTENYFIEAYGLSYKNSAQKDQETFENFLSAIKEN